MRPNEHFINQQDGNEQKRITDSSFSLEKNFSKYENDPAELEKLKREYIDFMTLLEQSVKNGKIFTHDRRTILEMSKKVLENIAAKYKNIQKEVKEIMGGRVLDYEG